MEYKVRVLGPGAHRLRRDYGTGTEGGGEAYRTRKGVEERARKLRKEFPSSKGFEVKVINVRSHESWY